MNGHGPPRTASTALGSPQASYAGRRSDSRIGRQSPLPPKPFNRQPSISTRRTRHPPEYSRPPDTTRCSPPIARSGTPRRTPSNLNISAIPRDRRDIRIRRILPISAPTPVIKNRGIPTIPMGDHLVRNRIALDSRTSRGSSDTGPGIRRILPQVQSTDLPCVGVVGHGELALMSSLAAGNATEPTA